LFRNTKHVNVYNELIEPKESDMKGSRLRYFNSIGLPNFEEIFKELPQPKE
jgi:hypothetical protein